MKQVSERAFLRKLRNNGYSFLRQNGNHAIYGNGMNTVSVPIRNFKSVIALRLTKELNLI